MNHVVERIDLNDKLLKPQTIAHHQARYQFACQVRKPQGQANDLACGLGYGTEMLRQAGYKAMGVDRDRKSIFDAVSSYPKCDFQVVDLARTPILNLGKFDLITMFEAIEHFPFSIGRDLLKEISMMLKEDGLFILSTPRDINDKYNRMHKSEWPYHLLKNELGSLFTDVRIYGQDWDTAQIDEENVRENDFYVAVCKK